MTHYAYIVISDSVPIMTKRFRVVASGWKPSKTKNQVVTPALGGGIDVSAGSLFRNAQYLVRVRHTELDANYGTKDDLDFFYSLNNPCPTSGSPSNVLTVTDHYGNVLHGYMDGEFAPEPISVSIEGSDAWFMIPTTLRFRPE